MSVLQEDLVQELRREIPGGGEDIPGGRATTATVYTAHSTTPGLYNYKSYMTPRNIGVSLMQ